jgi:hypothetical protein
MEVAAGRRCQEGLQAGRRAELLVADRLDHAEDRQVVAHQAGRRAELLAVVVDRKARPSAVHLLQTGPTLRRKSKGKELSL